MNNNHELTPEQLWQIVLGELELIISKASFMTWFKLARLINLEDNGETAAINVANEFTKIWFEKKYHKTILNVLQNATNDKIRRVIYKVGPVAAITATVERKPVALVEEKQVIKSEIPAIITNGNGENGLNPHYTFQTFVVGKGNELAQAACLAVVQTPGKKYNPLFIYGGVGLGKTHLLQAIGHEILKNNKKAKLLYLSSEKFTSEFVKAIRQGTMDSFKKTTREIDVFLVDDVQFFAGKEGIQEEFFHTFNELYQKNSQIVLTSDRLPGVIPALEERLISRFEWGMIVDIAPPDLETRIAILEQKIREKNYTLSKEIIQYLATQIQNNVRQLEGALNKIIAHYELNKIPVTLESAKKIVAGLTASPKKTAVTPKQLVEIVAEFYGLKVNNLINVSRKRELVVPRQIAMFLMREDLDASFPLIGQELGGRDHTTAMHAYKKIKQEMEVVGGKIKKEIDFIRQRLYNM